MKSKRENCYETYKIKDLLKDGLYYNILAIYLACRENGNLKPMIEWTGERESFKIIRNTIQYKEFIKNMGSTDRFPIALTNSGLIFIDHFQVAAVLLAGYDSIGIVRKKIPVQDSYFDRNWANKTFSEKNLELLDAEMRRIVEIADLNSIPV